MNIIEDIETLEAIYGAPGEASTVKVTPHLTPTYRAWIERSRLCVLSTIGPGGVDGSPRGDVGPVVTILDERTLALPDWRGNNRMDSLRNIVADGRLALMFLVPGSNNVIRINGRGVVTVDDAVTGGFEVAGKRPRSVVVIAIEEVYSQCARALMRSETWAGTDHSDGLPTVGDMLRDVTEGGFDGKTYDAEWAGRAAKTMW